MNQEVGVYFESKWLACCFCDTHIQSEFAEYRFTVQKKVGGNLLHKKQFLPDHASVGARYHSLSFGDVGLCLPPLHKMTSKMSPDLL